jgi:hypothetical protein
VQVPAPANEYWPARHGAAVGLADPATQKYPAVQLPVQVATVMAEELPNSPAGHGVHTPAPDRLYCPATQIAAVELVDPATHAYPAVHSPLHAAVLRPDTDPNVPAGHGAVHAAVGSAVVLPYSPALQLLQVPAPASEYVPTPQVTAVALTDPMGHAYPAVQGPLHAALGRAFLAP